MTRRAFTVKDSIMSNAESNLFDDLDSAVERGIEEHLDYPELSKRDAKIILKNVLKSIAFGHGIRLR